ncbi:MAG: hypothetical protein GKC04_05595 [Methanomicrobiales archaeon]|nr:hypothetical protein [Methanomicrobiales archaeon]
MADNVMLGFITAAVVIAVILLVAHLLVRTDGGNLLNIIRAEYWVPSLSLFQFLLWTIVISFSYLWVMSFRIFEGDLSFSMELPTNLYLLLGISVAVPLVSIGYTKEAYKPETLAKPPEKLPPFGMMLKNKGKIALNRFQMFLWTIVSIVLYLSIVVGTITGMAAALATPDDAAGPVDVSDLSVPDIDPTLLYLMGLSQTGYLGGRVLGEDKKAAKKAAKPPEEAAKASEPEVAAAAAPTAPARRVRRMTEGVLSFLIQDHPVEVQERLKAKIHEAEFKGLMRYYLVGDDFYYLVENGQMRDSSSRTMTKSDIWQHISDTKEEFGSPEVFEI